MKIRKLNFSDGTETLNFEQVKTVQIIKNHEMEQIKICNHQLSGCN
jgi:hypothetical protein